MAYPKSVVRERHPRSELPEAILAALREAGVPLARSVLMSHLMARWAPSTIEAAIDALIETGQLDRIGSQAHRHYAIAELD